MRTKIHYTTGCPHHRGGLADLRLACLQARVTGSYREAREVLSQTQSLRQMEQLQLRIYQIEIDWSTRAISTAEAQGGLDQIIHEINTSPGHDNEIVPELLCLRVNMYVHASQVSAARALAENFYQYCPITPRNEGLYNLAMGHIAFAASEPVSEVLKYFRHAGDIATEVGSSCYLEVCVTQLAVAYAACGRFGAARKCLEDIGLSLDQIKDHFWEPDQPQALIDMLRWYNFTTPR